MRRILLTEGQIKLITEEINKNDSIQKLIFTEPSKINFKICHDNNNYKLIPIIDNKEISDKFVKFLAKDCKFGDDTYYNLNIEVKPDIQRLGIAENMLTAFLLQGYPACQMKDDSVMEIDNLWNKLRKDKRFNIEDISDEKDNIIGLIAYKK